MGAASVNRGAVFGQWGEPIDRIETATEAGLAALREVSPIGKLPTAIVDGRVLYDSHVIVEWLAQHGQRPLDTGAIEFGNPASSNPLHSPPATLCFVELRSARATLAAD